MFVDILIMTKVRRDLVDVLVYSLTSSISDLFGVSSPAIVRRIGSVLLKRAESRRWVPKDLSDPVSSLNELLQKYKEYGYCDKIVVERDGGEIYIKSYGIIDYERIEKLVRGNYNPCTFTSALAMAFLSDYFNMSVTMQRLNFKLLPDQKGSEEVLEVVTVGG